MVVFGIVSGLLSLAVIANFKGIRDKHASRILAAKERARDRVGNSRTMADENDVRRRFTTATQLVVAVLFLLLAIALVSAGTIGIVQRLSAG